MTIARENLDADKKGEDQQKETSTVDEVVESDGKHWSEGLPEEMRAYGDVKETDSLEKFVSRYMDNKSYASKSIRIPTEDAGEEELNKFYQDLSRVPKVTVIPELEDKEGWEDLYKKIGVPDSADAYGVKDESLAEFMHKLSLNGGQAKRLAEYIETSSETKQKEFQEKQEEENAKLKREWGETYERRQLASTKMIKDYGGDEMFDLIEEFNLGNSPVLAKMMYNIQKKIGDPKMMQGDSVERGMDREELKNRIASMRNNPKDPMHNKEHPEHMERVKLFDNYHQRLYKDS